MEIPHETRNAPHEGLVLPNVRSLFGCEPVRINAPNWLVMRDSSFALPILQADIIGNGWLLKVPQLLKGEYMPVYLDQGEPFPASDTSWESHSFYQIAYKVY